MAYAQISDQSRMGPLLAMAALFMMLVFTSTAEAAGSYSSSSKSDKNDFITKAESQIAQKAYDKALILLDAGLKKEPNNADGWNLKGFSHRKLGAYDAAKAAYDKALSIKPNHERAMEYLGELYLTLDDLPQAEAMLEKLAANCLFNCKYRDMLADSIAAYKAAN